MHITGAVTAADSIFDYRGKSAADYAHPDFVPIFIESFNSTEISTAETECGGSESKSCVYDYLLTNDKAVALDTKAIDMEAKNTRTTLGIIIVFGSSNSLDRLA